MITADGVNIDVGSNSCLAVVDWNNDKKKDLVIGNEQGQIRIYLNTGSNDAPAFSSFSVVANVSHYRGSPKVCDLNGDGKKDLIVGDNDGYVYFHQNIGRNPAPSFASGGGVRLKTQAGSNIKVYYGAHIDLVDWDEDGSIDILVGDFYGYLELFINTETGSNITDPTGKVPVDFSLSQNHPNPFNATTTISYTIARPANVKLVIYNEAGQLVTTLINQFHPAGQYSFEWEASGVPSGLYMYRLEAANFSDIRKCILLK